MSEKQRPDPDGTEMVDLGDADVSAVEFESQRSLPPPLPAMSELSGPPSNAPPPPAAAYASMAPPPPRSNRFYVMLVVGFLAVGIVAGIAVAMGTRGEKKEKNERTASGALPAAHSASAAVMTLPIIDMNDDTEGDAGN